MLRSSIGLDLPMDDHWSVIYFPETRHVTKCRKLKGAQLVLHMYDVFGTRSWGLPKKNL